MAHDIQPEDQLKYDKIESLLLKNGVANSHRFFTDDPFFKLLGLSSFTYDEMYDALKAMEKDDQYLPYLVTDLQYDSSEEEPADAVEAANLQAIKLAELKFRILTQDFHDGPNFKKWNKETAAYEDTFLSDYITVDTNLKDTEIETVIIANDLYLKQKYKHSTDDTNYMSLVTDFTTSPWEFSKVEALVEDITTSIDNCLYWNTEFHIVMSKEGKCYRKITPKICLRLYDPLYQNKTRFAQPQPFFAAKAETQGGQQFAASSSFKNQNENDPARTDTFFEGETEEQDQVIENLAAGPLSMSYDTNTGEWESGTRQLIARLLTTVYPFESLGLPVEDIHSLTSEQLYSPSGPYNQGAGWNVQEHTGKAVPLYMHKGNANFFGPAMVQRYLEGSNQSEKSPNQKEEIEVWNRFPIKYNAGDMILCSRFHGKWHIIQSIKGEQSGPTFNVGKWSFKKLISNTDSYFRDARSYGYEGLKSTDPNVPFDFYDRKFTDGVYKEIMSNKFWWTLQNYSAKKDEHYAMPNDTRGMLTRYGEPPVVYPETISNGILDKIARLNLANTEADPDNERNVAYADLTKANSTSYTTFKDAITSVAATTKWDILPSTKHIQHTAFDQMGNFAGGKLSANLIARTNIEVPVDPNSTGDTTAQQMHEFWGPNFPDGYTVSELSKLINEQTAGIITCYPTIFYKGTVSVPPADSPFFFYNGTPDNGYIEQLRCSYAASAGQPLLTDGQDPLRLKSTYNPLGMFAGNNIANGFNLPAEVATNAHPDDDIKGSPLEDMTIMMRNYGINREGYTVDMIAGTRNIFASGYLGYQARFHWIFKVAENNPAEQDQTEDYHREAVTNSYYNLTPKNLKRISFLPLYAEAISSRDYSIKHIVPNWPNNGLNFSLPEYGLDRMMSKTLPYPKWHPAAGYPPLFGATSQLGGDFIFDRSLLKKEKTFYKWYGSQSFEEFEADDWKFPYIRYTKSGTSSNGQFKMGNPDWWPYSELQHGDNANCVGIISAKCKVIFRGTEFRFKTQNRFGIQATLPTSSTSVVSEGFGGMGIIGLIGAGQTSGGLPSGSVARWGRNTNGPWDFNTTALHVKVYDAWPDSQTLYDSRYFTVFHYNPGEIFSAPTVSEEKTRFISDSDIYSFYGPDKKVIADAMIELDEDIDHKVDQLDESVDFKVPTYIDNTPVPVGTIIHYELDFGGAIYDIKKKWADKKHWRVNTVRRGMMLPHNTNGGFRYVKTDCGIALKTDLEKAGHTGTGYNIKNPGTTAKLKDIFIVNGGGGTGASFEVTDVEPLDDDKFAVKEIKVLSRGTGFTKSSFFEIENNIAQPKLIFKNGDLEIEFHAGIVYEIINTDKAPTEHAGDGGVLLTPRDMSSNGEVDADYNEQIQIVSPHKDGAYDMFFHFHNDITHTYADSNGQFGVFPQFVTLDISAV